MYTASWTFVVGATLQAAAVNMLMLQIPRLLSGAGIGALSMCSPVYISELAPKHHRGQLATLWQMAIVTGIVLVSILNLWLKNWDEGWRISYGGNVLFALILIGMLIVMPESPRYLVGKEMHEEARAALSKVRFEDQLDGEMAELDLEAKAEVEQGVSTWSEIFDNDNRMRYRIMLGIGLQSIQQLSGINAIMFYAPRILEDFFGSSGGILGALILNIINFLATFITIGTVESVGRAKLLFTGGIVMCFALVMTAIFASLEETRAFGYLIIVFCGLYVIGFAYSWGPVVWVYCAEMFPLRSRGKATGLTTFSNWAWTTIVGAVFPAAASASLTGCFGFFAGIVFVAIFLVYFYLPETANRTILEIDEDFKNQKPEFPRKKWN
jgi:sugar porter (SP) family MFS transporter